VKAQPRPWVGAGDGVVFERRSPPWRHHWGALVPLPTTLAWAIRVKTQAPASGAGDGGVFVTSLLRASPWRVDGCLLRATSLLSGLVDVGAVGPGWMLHAEAAASESDAALAQQGGAAVGSAWVATLCRLCAWF
jgi:hypothetical protein